MGKIDLEHSLPMDIEGESMAIIASLLGDKEIAPENKAAVMRAIHATADFDFADSLYFSPGAVEKGIAALKRGAMIVTDTQMALAGVNKKALSATPSAAVCYISDADVAERAKAETKTRAAASIEKSLAAPGPKIYAVGNAPTALIRIYELIKEGELSPDLVIGVPVGFVNVVESKELIMESGAPCIVARGRKGGSGVAAAILNALIYQIARPQA
jgi:precorrin-8X/cobalt-precorrin-8 methylmutase